MRQLLELFAVIASAPFACMLASNCPQYQIPLQYEVKP